MADRWAVANGNWSDTATWDGGTLPGAADDVYADGRSITINQDITVLSIRTTQRTGGTAGGTFTAQGSRTINANVIAGASTCLLMNAPNTTLNGNTQGGPTSNIVGAIITNGTSVHNGNSVAGGATGAYGTSLGGTGAIQNGNSSGGTATSLNVAGTLIGSGCVQNGNSVGSSSGSARGTIINPLGVQNGTATGGSGTSAIGTVITSGGVLNGDSFGGPTNNSSAHGCTIAAGGLHIGNAYGMGGTNVYGNSVAAGGVFRGNSYGANSGTTSYGSLCSGMHIGDSFGGSGTNAIGTALQGIHYGNATGGTGTGAHGTALLASGAAAIINTATGNTSGAFGVQSPLTSTRAVALIKTEVGSFAKSLTSFIETTDTNVAYVNYNAGGGGGGSSSARQVNIRGGADQ